jgi:hypothetical protein
MGKGVVCEKGGGYILNLNPNASRYPLYIPTTGRGSRSVPCPTGVLFRVCAAAPQNYAALCPNTVVMFHCHRGRSPQAALIKIHAIPYHRKLSCGQTFFTCRFSYASAVFV